MAQEGPVDTNEQKATPKSNQAQPFKGSNSGPSRLLGPAINLGKLVAPYSLGGGLVWGLSSAFGPGDPQFWDWSPQTWQAVAGGTTGYFLAAFAYATLRGSRQREQAQTINELLQEGLRIFGLNEAWLLEGADDSVILSENKDLPFAHNGNRFFRQVEVRAVLDEGKWGATDDNFYQYRESRRTWIVRNQQTNERAYQDKLPASTFPPALLSSVALEELSTWIDRVAFARSEGYLTPYGLRMLRGFVRSVAQEDRRKVLRPWLSDEAVKFLEWYANQHPEQKDPSGT